MDAHNKLSLIRRVGGPALTYTVAFLALYLTLPSLISFTIQSVFSICGNALIDDSWLDKFLPGIMLLIINLGMCVIVWSSVRLVRFLGRNDN